LGDCGIRGREYVVRDGGVVKGQIKMGEELGRGMGGIVYRSGGGKEGIRGWVRNGKMSGRGGKHSRRWGMSSSGGEGEGEKWRGVG
jgi:hypothetical protein